MGCYTSMFSGCSSLTTAPELPATNLVDYCYAEMFLGCTGLTTAPALPAITLANYCYASMFYGCSNLSSITVHFTSWDGATSATGNWVSGMAGSGEFHCPLTLPDEVSANDKKPSGWMKVPLL